MAMEGSRFVVVGRRPLVGTVAVRGAKNAALKTMAASLLFSDQVVIENVPLVEDVFRMSELLRDIGSAVEVREHQFRIIPMITRTALSGEIAKRIRASVVLIGPLLARMGRVTFSHPGGCVIGKRPIDLFLEGWEAMGVRISAGAAGYDLDARELHGAEFTFRTISVTGTEALLMTAVLASGRTVLSNAACEPEIPALADFLNACGARIAGAGSSTITIDGTGGVLLAAAGRCIKTIPDRIETGTFLAIGALLGNPITITECIPEHVAVPLQLLHAMGVPIETGADWIRVRRSTVLTSIDIKTREYPGFPTDLQAPFVVLLTQAAGEGLVFETVFEGRLSYIDDLNRMGARITLCDPHRVIVHGPTPLRGREIESPDIRAGLAFLLAALTAEGQSTVHNIYQIDRGYEKIEERLNTLGAEVRRMA